MDFSFFHGGMVGITIIVLVAILAGRLDVAARMVVVGFIHAAICAVMGW